MRVLLFVQNDGDKRPKCVSWWPCGSGPKTFAEVQQRTSIGTVADTCWDGRPVWLVECADAEAGRKCIAVGLAAPHPYGRILASGGKR